MTRRFEGRRVLITGAAGGMGRAFADAFAAEGAALVLTDLDATGLQTATEALRAQGAACDSHVLDLAREGAVLEFASRFAGQKLDVLINNAGLAYGEVAFGFEKLGQEKWLRFLAVNAVAPLILAQALRAPLAAAKGVILNISSMASYSPGTAYGVTKAALNAMTYGMAGTFGAEGVRVNAIAPGIMQTPASVGSLPPETYARVQGQQTLKAHGTAEDIARLAVFLASDEARFIHGEIVNCDAGNRLRGWRG
jgi:NAD(P)-dependent dehydrogenase (short-subunit alcohol dehydrogenase family)